jgi:hypothetical protein
MNSVKYQSLVMLAALGLSVQANYGADSLAPSGYLNAGLGSDLAAMGPNSVVGGAVGSMDANVMTSGSAPIFNNPGQSFVAAVPGSIQNNIPAGPEPLVIPEPTTLALTSFGGLTALICMRRFGKNNRA